MIQISNSNLIVTISQEGGALTSIRDAASGREFLWQGDPAYWTARPPTCSPLWGGCIRRPIPCTAKPTPWKSTALCAMPR